jgi:hypothetical protein
MKTFLRHLTVDIALSVVCAAAVLALLGASSTRLREKESAHAEAASQMRAVLTTELRFARAGAGDDDVRRSVASLQSFVATRAGVTIDPGVADRLAALERRALDGNLRRLEADELGEIFARVLLERVRELDDAELASVADGFENAFRARPDRLGYDWETNRAIDVAIAKRERGTTARRAELPGDAPGRMVALRADGGGLMEASKLDEHLRDLRLRLQTPQVFALVWSQAGSFVGDFLDERIELVAAAAPETWGEASSAGMTPLQTVLLAYSAASDDTLYFTTEELEHLREQEVGRYLRAVGDDRAAARRAPFGRYGDVFSTPIDLVFDARTLNRLLDRIEERGSR